MESYEGRPQRRVKSSLFRKEVFDIINKKWPIHASDVCRLLHIPVTIANIAKVGYYFKMLKNENKINTKKVDRALIVWPKDIEKLRFLHDFIKEEEQI